MTERFITGRLIYMHASSWTLFLFLPVLFGLIKLTGKRRRGSIISPAQERVLIIGASSGIGREIARQYAARIANVCVVGRREDKVTAVVNECKAMRSLPNTIIGVSADFASPEDMVRVRSIMEKGISYCHFWYEMRSKRLQNGQGLILSSLLLEFLRPGRF